MQTWKLQSEVEVLQEKLATLQTNFDQLKNTTTNFVGHLNGICANRYRIIVNDAKCAILSPPPLCADFSQQ